MHRTRWRGPGPMISNIRTQKEDCFMSKVKIKSENQSGGVTAQNVNTGSNSTLSINTPTPEKERKIKVIFWWIFGLLGAVSAIVAILKYFS